MLVLKDSDSAVLSSVEPKNIPATRMNHRVGRKLSQPKSKEGEVNRLYHFPASIADRPYCELWTEMFLSENSIAQIIAINPEITRIKATFGISILEVAASEIAYSRPKNINGTNIVAINQSPSMHRPVCRSMGVIDADSIALFARLFDVFDKRLALGGIWLV